MLLRSPESPAVTTSEKNEASVKPLQLAIFDLGARAFASLRFDTPALIEDTENEEHVSTAKRIESFHERHPSLNLPPLKNMGFLFKKDEDLNIAVVKTVHERGVKFRDFTLRRYNIEELHEHVLQLNSDGNGTADTEALDLAFNTIPDLKMYRHTPKQS